MTLEDNCIVGPECCMLRIIVHFPHTAYGIAYLWCNFRKGTVVKTTFLVFIAGSLMGFSRICGSPEMVILGRFITGIHSGNLLFT